MKTIWIFAGEASGDLYGARLARELRRQAPGLRLQGMGGRAMHEAGVELLVDSSDLGVIGLVEVLKQIRTFWRLFHGLVRRAAAERPAAVVLIDYPGFNLRFAQRMLPMGVPVAYYISPQVWAWGKRRIPQIARTVRKMLTIFPFESAVYAGSGLDVEFVGHPLLEILAERRDAALVRDPRRILLLPGSRAREIDSLLPDLVRTAGRLHQRHPELHFVLATPDERIAARCRQRLAAFPEGAGLPLEIVVGETHAQMQLAGTGLAASGTVTMEAAILGLPLVVVYRVNCLTYWLGRLLVRLPFFCIVNLVAGRRVFAEFLQGDVRSEVLAPALEAILPGGPRRAEVEAGMAEAVSRLGGREPSSARAAAAVLALAGGGAPE
ncbi:MAG: lipid-A-disaccharide synthase [Lentisphaeria bacterium]|jgi:lipid-A-disaccharide synthase